MAVEREALREWHRLFGSQHSEHTGGMLRRLFQRYEGEGFAMSYTLADFGRDYLKEQFTIMQPQERRDILQTLPPRERREALQSLPLRERRELLQSLPSEDRRQILESLSQEEQEEFLDSLPVKTRLAGLSAEQIQQYLNKLTAGRTPKPRESRKKL